MLQAQHSSTVVILLLMSDSTRWSTSVVVSNDVLSSALTWLRPLKVTASHFKSFSDYHVLYLQQRRQSIVLQVQACLKLFIMVLIYCMIIL